MIKVSLTAAAEGKIMAPGLKCESITWAL